MFLTALLVAGPGCDGLLSGPDRPPAPWPSWPAVPWSVNDSAPFMDAGPGDLAPVDPDHPSASTSNADAPGAGPDSAGALPPLAPPDAGGTPPPGPSSFHTVTHHNPATWNSILGLGQNVMIAAQNPQAGVQASRWARNIHTSHYTTPTAMADAMHLSFTQAGGPAAILIDEAKTATQGYIKQVADRMRAVYPQWNGRWGAYLVNGPAISYPNLTAVIDALLDADAIIVAEMYPYRSAYCQSGGTTAGRDQWLGDFFHGSRGAFPMGRFHWLMQRRKSRGSASHVTVVFGVTDKFAGATAAAKFIDRMFYVWITRSGYPATISLQNGGPGAWKWDVSAVGNTSRDLAFVESFQHYVVAGRTSSRLGPACP